jgi:ABC-type dipeptide/oligopeptide/nickel transport system permease component
VVQHVLRNALISTVTRPLGLLLAGRWIETVFDKPGLGLMPTNRSFSDHQAILGVTLLSGFVYAVVNLGVMWSLPWSTREAQRYAA